MLYSPFAPPVAIKLAKAVELPSVETFFRLVSVRDCPSQPTRIEREIAESCPKASNLVRLLDIGLLGAGVRREKERNAK